MKRLPGIKWVAAALCSYLLSCTFMSSSDNPDAFSKNDGSSIEVVGITGRVFSSEGSPVSDASVYVNEHIASCYSLDSISAHTASPKVFINATDAKGYFYIEYSGRGNVSFITKDKNGNAAFKTCIIHYDEDIETIALNEFILQPCGSIRGTLEAENQNAYLLDNSCIEIVELAKRANIGLDKRGNIIYPDVRGMFVIDSIPAGTYTLIVRPSKISAIATIGIQKLTVEVKAGEQTLLEPIVLEERNDSITDQEFINDTLIVREILDMNNIPQAIKYATWVTDNRVTYLNLFSFEGTYYEITKLPDNILSLDELEWLDYFNVMDKTIPVTICQMQQLRKLRLCEGQLSELPDDFSNLINLEYLDISANRFEHIPEMLFSLPRLQFVCVSFNMLTNVTEKEREWLDVFAEEDWDQVQGGE